MIILWSRPSDQRLGISLAAERVRHSLLKGYGLLPISERANTPNMRGCHPDSYVFMTNRRGFRRLPSCLSVQKVRAPLFCQLQRLFLAPLFDGCMIAGSQNLRNFLTFENLRAGVMRVFQQSCLETFMRA